MYNTDAMGVRIGEIRRARGMTQQALAEALGISGQAVSKWESGLGYPDITLLPAIADTLGVPIQVLFGAEPDYPITPIGQEGTDPDDAPTETLPVPTDAPTADDAESPEEAVRTDAAAPAHDSFSEAQLDASLEATLLAAEEALRSVPDSVKGAMDEARAAVNEAKQAVRDAKDEIGQTAGETPSVGGTADGKHDVPNHLFGAGESVTGIRSLYVKTQGGADINIYKSNDGVCHWEAIGTQEFAEKVLVTAEDDKLQVVTPTRAEMAAQTKHWSLFGFPFSAGTQTRQTNRVDIWLGASEGESVDLHVLGAGDIHCQPTFASARLMIQGSGDIDYSSAVNLTASIAGSGDIGFERADFADLRIAGSGDIDAREITHSLKASIAGSGDIDVRESCLRSLQASITGSGDLNLDQLEADEVKIKVLGSGDVVIAGGCVRHLTATVSGAGDVSMPGVTAQSAYITLHGATEMTIGAILEPCRLQKDKLSTLRILNNK